MEKEAAGAGADNQFFDVKESGLCRRPKISTEEGRLGQSYRKFRGRRKARTGIDVKISTEEGKLGQTPCQIFRSKKKD